MTPSPPRHIRFKGEKAGYCVLYSLCGGHNSFGDHIQCYTTACAHPRHVPVKDYYYVVLATFEWSGYLETEMTTPV